MKNVNIKRIIVMVLIIMIVGTMPVMAKGKKVKCPVCTNGKSVECPYWCGDEHMTPHEIQDYDIMEMRYDSEDVSKMTQKQKNKLTPWWRYVHKKWKVEK